MLEVFEDFVHLVCNSCNGGNVREVEMHVEQAVKARTISLILGVPLRDGSLLDGLLEGTDITKPEP